MSYLDVILEHKRTEIHALRGTARARDCRARALQAPPTLGFRAALLKPSGPHLIAELKKASPSKGLIRPDYEPVAFARRYQAAGASCISCLTDEKFFQGSIAHLRDVRQAVTLPILRKDFTLDPIQIDEARAEGADAILLIAAALTDAQMSELHDCARQLSLDVLVEIHDEPELHRVLTVLPDANLLGVNNRDLKTFRVDLATTESLAAALQQSRFVLVGESGIETRNDVLRLARAGAHAVLVGETLMRSPDPADAVRELLATSAPPEPRP